MTNVEGLKRNRILYLLGQKELLERQVRRAQDEIAAAQNEIDRLVEHIGYHPGRGQDHPEMMQYAIERRAAGE